jgi:hypothetical protein
MVGLFSHKNLEPAQSYGRTANFTSLGLEPSFFRRYPFFGWAKRLHWAGEREDAGTEGCPCSVRILKPTHANVSLFDVIRMLATIGCNW